MMGPARGDYETAAVHEKVLSLMHKAGYEVVYPKVCCGDVLHYGHCLLMYYICHAYVVFDAAALYPCVDVHDASPCSQPRVLRFC